LKALSMDPGAYAALKARVNELKADMDNLASENNGIGPKIKELKSLISRAAENREKAARKISAEEEGPEAETLERR